MGSRALVSIGIVLLIAGGEIWASADRRSGETLNQTRPGGEEAGPRPRGHLSYRLRIYQLRRTATEKEEEPRPLGDPQRSEGAGGGTSKQLGLEAPVRGPALIRGPDLNPPLEPQTRVTPIADHRVPVPAASVAARCGEAEVALEVNQNFFGNGQLIHPSDLTLGGCAAQHASDGFVGFQAGLRDCNSMLNMTDDALVYSFSLVYSPTPIGNTAVLKTNPAEVVIECHYQRRHYVSSSALRPAWTPFAAMLQVEKRPRFSLLLATDDWQSPRHSNVFFLNDMIRVEAAVLRGHHVPLRIYVDSCAATVTPDPGSQPRYPFVDNHGCLSDSKLTGAKSFFLQRSQEDKLQFQLKAFRLQQGHNSSVHITCRLEATTLSVPVDSRHKACSFLTEASRWVASDGDNAVCRCCETDCGERRRKRRRVGDSGTVTGSNATSHLGFPPHAQRGGGGSPSAIPPVKNTQELPRERAPRSPTASSSSVGLVCGTALALLAFAGTVFWHRTSRPTVKPLRLDVRQ